MDPLYQLYAGGCVSGTAKNGRVPRFATARPDRELGSSFGGEDRFAAHRADVAGLRPFSI